MVAVGGEWERLGARDRAQRKRGVEVGEEGAAARWLPAQGIAELEGVDPEQHETGAAGVVTSGRFLELLGGREMNETVAQIVLGAVKHPRPLRIGPSVRVEQAIDGAGIHAVRA